MIEKVKQVYEYLYSATSGNRNFEFKPKERELKIIENFVKNLGLSHGDDWLFDFMCFQFSRYVDLKTRFGKGRIMLGWVIGDKAFKKYISAPNEEKYWGEAFKTRFELRNPLNKALSCPQGKSHKDRERARFKDLERQLIHCYENGLFSYKNKICMFCKNKELCRVSVKLVVQ